MTGEMLCNVSRCRTVIDQQRRPVSRDTHSELQAFMQFAGGEIGLQQFVELPVSQLKADG